uniref:Polymerase nucleotidyl transferase domain-containing protein n=1 Tax=Alexandrium monilatum TaxID=311494 RepID=A0A7S4Q0Z9_9DINO
MVHQSELLRGGRMKRVLSSGSTRLRLDTPHSDLDLILDMGSKPLPVKELYEEILRLQQDLEVRRHFQRFSEVTPILKTFAVTLPAYYRGLDFDLVPMAERPELGRGLWQWNPRTGAWQQALTDLFYTRFEHLCERAPGVHKGVRLLKLWNEALPRWRRPAHEKDPSPAAAAPDRRGPADEVEGGKAPLVGAHIMLLALAARTSGDVPEDTGTAGGGLTGSWRS